MTKNNKIIKSAGGIVIRRENNSWKIALLYKNQGWFFPKGQTKGNETEKQTAIREIKEELGILPKELKIITKLGYMNYIASQKEDGYTLKPKTVALFLAETKNKELKFLKEDGFQEANWFDLKQALRIVPFPEMKDMILKTIFFLERKNKKQTIKTIVVGVGGKGERMKLKNFPKLLLPIQGRPYLGYLLDTLLSCPANFNQIYLFTHHYAKEIEQFIKSNYSQISKIKTVFTGANSFAQQLYSAKNLLDEDFIYMDGNVICEHQLFQGLSQKHLASEALISLAVSSQNLAPTHFQIQLDSRGKIIDLFSGLLSHANKEKKDRDLWCTMGIHAVSHYIFDLLPDLIYFYDLDLIVDVLVKSATDFPIAPYIYKKEWYCLHNKEDYKMMKVKGKNFFSKIK